MTHAPYDAAVDAKLALLGGIYKKTGKSYDFPVKRCSGTEN